MKNLLFTIFKIAIGIVLFAKVLNWIFKFNDEVNQLINTSMFCLIGIAYIVVGFVYDNKWIKAIIITCGLFLLAMNFMSPNNVLDILAIACLLVPMLIGRFYKEGNAGNVLKADD